MSKDMKARLAKIANSLDEKAYELPLDSPESQEILSISSDIDDIIKSFDVPEVVKTPPAVEEVEAKTHKSVAKLSKKDRSTLRAFQKAATKVLDRISVGRKEFPDVETRMAMAGILGSLDKGIDALEEFGLIPSTDKTASKQQHKDELEVRLYKTLLASGYTRKSLITAKVVDEDEADYLEDSEENS